MKQLIFNELTEENLFLYAAKHYYNPQFSDIDEFYEDLKRFKYIKRLANRYLETDELAERLILNHMIVVFNAFVRAPQTLSLNARAALLCAAMVPWGGWT